MKIVPQHAPYNDASKQDTDATQHRHRPLHTPDGPGKAHHTATKTAHTQPTQGMTPSRPKIPSTSDWFRWKRLASRFPASTAMSRPTHVQ